MNVRIAVWLDVTKFAGWFYFATTIPVSDQAANKMHPQKQTRENACETQTRTRTRTY